MEIKERGMEKYYFVGKKNETEYSACRFEIKWNVEQIADCEKANGYIVQHFTRKEIPTNIITSNDEDYYEAWKVINGLIIYSDGKTSSDFDDAFALGMNFVDEVSSEELADHVCRSAGTTGEIRFNGEVYWIPIDDELYSVVDKWENGAIICAGNLKATYKFDEIKSRKILFRRSEIIHKWNMKEENKIYDNVIRVLSKDIFASCRDENIELNVKEMNVSEELKNRILAELIKK